MEVINFDLNYDYKNFYNSDVRSLVNVINLLGKDLVGAEVGVFEAQSFMTLLHNCPNIKTLYGIDSYEPYVDYIKNDYDGTPALVLDKKTVSLVKSLSFNRIKYSGMENKVVFYEEDSNIAAKKIEDESLDFIFLDSYLTYEQAKNDLKIWFPKVKKNGLFAGHDYVCEAVYNSVNEFRLENNIKNTMSVYDSCWCWIK